MTATRPWLREMLSVFAALLLIGWSYYRGISLAGGHFVSKQPAGYYGLLTDALLDGQLHLKIQPDPRMLRLANPYEGPQGTNRPHDMSFYRGRFYLYYGVTPVLILFGPWRLVAGTYLTEIAATTTFNFCGVVLWSLWLWHIKRRLFPGVSSFWLLLAIISIGWGSPVFLHCNDDTFYLVPITAAYACLAAVALFILHAALSGSATQQAVWLGLASLFYGLAVGARPNYVLGVPLLAGAALIFWLRVPRNERWRQSGLSLWLAAAVPAAAIGLGLAMYNYLRFHNPFDFGIRFSLASGDLRHMRLLGPEFIGTNLKLYLLHPASFFRYYPFIFTLQRPFGVLPHLPLAAVALFFPLTLFCKRLRMDPVWSTSGLVALGATLANLMLLCCFFGGEDRYLLDFVPPAMALAGAISFHLAGPAPRLQLVRWTYLVVAGWTLLNGVLLGLINRPDEEKRLGLERAANTVVSWLERAAGTQHGPLLLKVRLPHRAAGTKETLLITGDMCGVYDAIYVHYLEGENVQFGFDHLGAAGPVSEPMPLSREKAHSLELHLGSLYPPATHPFFSGLSPAMVARLRRTVEIKVDGSMVLRAAVAFYPSTPGCVVVGCNPHATDRFSGEILQVRRLGLMPSGQPPPGRGPIRLQLKFPSYRPGIGQPLLSTGRFGAGDLILLKFLEDGRVRLGHDSWGGGLILSEAFSVDPTHIYTLDVDFGALRELGSSDSAIIRKGLLRLRLDGETMLAVERPYNPTTADEVIAGYNLTRASSSENTFTGRIISIENIPPWQDAPVAASSGPIVLAVIFNPARPGISEPLLVSGKTGAADVVLVKYEDAFHVRLGLDHWAVGMVLSEPIPIDYGSTHRIEINLGSLHSQPVTDPQSLVSRVMFNGEVILTAPWPAYPAGPGEITVGWNTIGASTCEPEFTGRVLAAQRRASP